MEGFKMSEYKKFLGGEEPGIFCAWINIVVFLICIFPLGLIAYWKRTKADKSTYLHTWKLILIFGIIITIFGLRVFAATGGAIVNVLIGILLILISLLMRRTAFLRMDIIGMLLVNREFNVRKIALALHKNEKIIHNEILEMIKKGMLPGVVVDYDTNEVFVPGYSGGTVAEYMERTNDGSYTSDIEENIEIDEDTKGKAGKKNLSPMETGICSCCGVKLTEEAIENKKCQLCGRIFDADYDDDEDEEEEE